ncbi:MAG: glycosyltransferase family 2 protein [Lachnospiraceae bacterium]|nr:glycosyltransferase family 2 protein [Lachnospiraceae bacterium]
MGNEICTGKPILWIVIPCYNEESVLQITAPMFKEELDLLINTGRVSDNSRILFVNDASCDGTWDIIKGLSSEDEHCIGISQSRNRGHQNSVLAGMLEAKEKCDIIISIDCDGQDDISAMTEMVDKYLGGAEIVYGVRNCRKTDTFFKRFTAESFYRIINGMGAEVVFNHADYRLVSSIVLDSFSDFKEVNIFLRGLFPLVGYRSEKVYYKRSERLAGESHYPLKKMIHLAFDGITSLSIKPISIITAVGLIVSVMGFAGVIWAIIVVALNRAVVGWPSLVCILCFLSGIQLLSLGVIGEYIGKIYMESKHRPRYIISERTWEKTKRQYKG